MKSILSYIPSRAAGWIAFFGAALLFFSLFRFLFMILHLNLVKASQMIDILYAFALGLLFDSMILSLLILPQYLFAQTTKTSIFESRPMKIFLSLNSIIFGFIFFLSTVDLRYIDHFGDRLNYWTVAYIDYPWLMVYSLIVSGDFFQLIAVWLVILIAFILFVRTIFRRLALSYSKINRKISSTIHYIFATLLVISIASGFGFGFPGWSTAFFCDNHFINRLSFNCLYTLGRSVYKTSCDKNRVAQFYDIKKAHSTTQSMLGIKSNNESTGINLKFKSKQNSNLAFSPNIITIIMEGWTAERVGALGAKINVSPGFDSLSRHGILFTQFYANGIRTNRGIPSVLCSFPSLPGRSVMQADSGKRPFLSLAEVLKDDKYTSIYAYGGNIEFDNMSGFLRDVGYDQLYGRDEFQTGEDLSQWGVADHILFDELTTKIKDIPRPFNLSIMTMSNHEPFVVPDDRFVLYEDNSMESKQLNAFYYSDWAIKRFIDSLSQLPIFDSTIFVLTADHCPHQSAKYPLDPNMFRVPLLIYAPSLIGDSAVIINKTTSQVDIIPTLVDLIGLETELYCWGRNVLSLDDSDPGFAVINAEDKFGLIEGSMLYFHWLDATTELYDITDRPYLGNNLIETHPALASDMQRRLDSYIQLAWFLATR